MTSKENFIKKMQHFFNVTYNDFTISRIHRWLDEFSEENDMDKMKAKKKLEEVQRKSMVSIGKRTTKDINSKYGKK